MRKFAVILGVMLVCSGIGCQGTKSRPSRQSSKPINSNPMDTFYSINYSQAGLGRSENTQLQPDSIDRLFPQNGPNGNITAQNTLNAAPQDIGTNPAQPPISRQKKSIARKQDQPKSNPVARSEAPDTLAIADTSMPRKQGQPKSMPVTRSEAPDTAAIADSGPQRISLIYPSPDYGIIKLDKLIPQEVDLSIPFKYTIVITNMTNAPLTNIVVTEMIASSFQFKGASPSPQQVDNQLLWRIDSLAPKTSERIEITGIPSNLETLKHSTGIMYTAASPSNIRVVQSTLELKLKVPAEALMGDTFPIEYIVKNTGSGTAQDVKIVEPLPAGMTTQDGKNEVRFEVGSLSSGQSRSFTAYLKPARTGTFVSKATALSSSSAQAESGAMPIQIRQPILAVNQNGPERVYFGRPIEYVISIVNQGDGPANDTVLEDVLPAGVTDIQASPVANISGTKMTWTLGTLSPNSTKTIHVSFKPSATGVLSSTATVKAHCADSTGATVSTSVVGFSSVRLDLKDLEDPVEVGGLVTYVISAVNEGTALDHNIRVICDLEDKLQYVSSSGPGQASMMGRTLSFSLLRTLDPSEKVIWRVVTKATGPGSVRFKVTLSSDELTRPIEQMEATLLYE